MVNLGNDWDILLKDEFSSEYYRNLRYFLAEEYATKRIYPDMYDIFNALKLTSREDTRVVIFGQDPYHGQGQAHGLAFSVQKGIDKPPSLKNIFKELSADVGFKEPPYGDLTGWARQGVLLLNTTLTVREGSPTSHFGKGWERLTDRIISVLNESPQPICFLLWGANARAKAALIDGSRHKILEAPHPSPLSASRGFFGCRHFSRANEFLASVGRGRIDWSDL